MTCRYVIEPIDDDFRISKYLNVIACMCKRKMEEMYKRDQFYKIVCPVP